MRFKKPIKLPQNCPKNIFLTQKKGLKCNISYTLSPFLVIQIILYKYKTVFFVVCAGSTPTGGTRLTRKIADFMRDFGNC